MRMDNWKKKLKKIKEDLPRTNVKPVKKVRCRPSQEEIRVLDDLIRRRKRK